MCGGEEEEVKIFIDIHVHLVQVPKSSDRTREKKETQNKWVLLFLRFCKKSENKEDLLSPVKLPLFQHLHPREKNRNG